MMKYRNLKFQKLPKSTVISATLPFLGLRLGNPRYLTQDLLVLVKDVNFIGINRNVSQGRRSRTCTISSEREFQSCVDCSGVDFAVTEGV